MIRDDKAKVKKEKAKVISDDVVVGHDGDESEPMEVEGEEDHIREELEGEASGSGSVTDAAEARGSRPQTRPANTMGLQRPPSRGGESW